LYHISVLLVTDTHHQYTSVWGGHCQTNTADLLEWIHA